MMKKILCLLLSLIFILTSCKAETDKSETSSPNNQSSSEEAFSDVSSEEEESSDSSEELILSVTDKSKYEANLKRTGTYTGREKLPKLELVATDPDNERGLSETFHGYSFGVAKNGKAHQTSLNHQANFDSKNYNALTVDTITEEKVLYLTFDCGYEAGYTSTILDILKEKNVQATFFCTLHMIKSRPELIARMIEEGHIVANHSVNHYSMPTIDRETMVEEILGVENYLREYFGYSSPYFRFPAGEYSDNSLDLVTEIGFRSVFWSVAYADYDVNNQPGRKVAFDTVTARLHPGAVILLHNVSSSNTEALGDIIDEAEDQGYAFVSLDEYTGWRDRDY